MSELSFEQMLEESSFKSNTYRRDCYRSGHRCQGRRDHSEHCGKQVRGHHHPRSEYTNEPSVDLRTKVQVGDEMEAKVLKVNDGEGMVCLILQETGC